MKRLAAVIIIFAMLLSLCGCRKTKVTIDMITELVGKDVVVTCFNESFARQCTIIAVEENWIKVEDKKKISIINADMIRDITIIKPKNA